MAKPLWLTIPHMVCARCGGSVGDYNLSMEMLGFDDYALPICEVCEVTAVKELEAANAVREPADDPLETDDFYDEGEDE